MKKFSILIAATILYSCADSPAERQAAPPRLPVASITTGEATTFQEYPAAIQGEADVEIRPQVEGILESLLVDEGAFVTKGQAIFKIADKPFRERLSQAKASQAAAEASLSNAGLEVEKLNPLVENKVVSDYQLKTAIAALGVAKATLAQRKSEVGTAQIDLGYTLIKAPVSGYIGRLEKKQGSLVSPTEVQALTNVSDVRNVHVYFALGENDFVNFKTQYHGRTLQDKIKNLPPVSLVLSDKSVYAQSGIIDIVDGQFDKSTGAITFRATFPNKDGLLRSGNTGKIRLSLLHANILKIPSDATIELQDKVFVYTVGDSNKVSKQPIVILAKHGNDYLVKDGLSKGQRIVLSGVDKLQDGLIITPEPAKNKTASVVLN